MSNPKKSLPPGVEDEPVFGTMWIRAGTLKLIRQSKAQYQVLCQFWGQKSPSKIKTRSDMPNNEAERTQVYDVRCPVIYFVEYLKQMKNNLKFEVEGVGKVHIDIMKFLNKKKQITIDSRQAFDHFNGFFQIIGKGNRKAGSLQVEMGTLFDPQVAYKQIGEEALEQMRQSYASNCPLNHIAVQGCKGTCMCHGNKKHRSQKEEQQNLDKRIPHSLDIQQRAAEEFQAQKYVYRELENLQKRVQKSEQNELIKEGSKQQFPQIPQILTYSGLRLDHGQNQANEQQLAISESQRVQQISNTPQLLENSKDQTGDKLKKVDTPLLKLMESVEEQKPKYELFEEFYEQPVQQIRRKQQPIKQPQQTLSQKKQNLEKNQKKFEVQPHRNSSPQFFIDERYFKDKGKIVEDLIEQNQSPQILSKVINIDQELMKQSKVERFPLQKPPSLQYDALIRKQGGEGPTFREIPDKIPVNTSFKSTRQLRKTNQNSLIMNLVIQIDSQSVKFVDQTKKKFNIAYRPYGCKERMVMGPNFSQKITILSPVGEVQIRKMDKTPFILQFWDSVNGKFLGIFKISLHKIKKGFLLNNRLNQISIKTNLLPTVIHRGLIAIRDVSEVETGQCDLYAAIGTSPQLNTYFNDPSSKFKQSSTKISQQKINNNRNDKPEREGESAIKQEGIKQIDENIIHKFDKFLNKLDSRSNCLVEKIMRIPKQKKLTEGQFKQIFGEVSNCQEVYSFLKAMKHNQSGCTLKDLSECFDDYKQMIAKISRNFKAKSSSIFSSFKNQKQRQQVLTKCRQVSQFYIIQKETLRLILSQLLSKPIFINQYLEIFGQDISLTYLEQTLNRLHTQFPNIFQLNSNFLSQQFQSEVYQRLKANNLSPDTVLYKLQECPSLPVLKLKQYLEENNIMCSIWLIIHLFEEMKVQFQLEGIKPEQPIPLSIFYNWMVLMQKKNKGSQKQDEISCSHSGIEKEENGLQLKKQIKSQPEIQFQQQKEEKKEEQRDAQKEENQKQPMMKQSDENPKQIEKSGKIQADNQSKEEAEKSLEKQNIANISNKHPAEEKPQIYKYLFTLQPNQIQLESPISGNCQISYIFPYQQESIKSKAFQTMIDKSKYQVKMMGTHGFSIQDSPQNYLGDNFVKFIIRIDNRIEYEGALHVDELLIEPNSKETKVIPLFSDRLEGMAGKIRMVIEYEKGINSSHTLGKQTTYQLFLPKNGYINYEINAQIDPVKIKNQLHLKEDFYISLVFDPFFMAPNLKTLFPPAYSKLYSAPKVIHLNGSIKVNLSSLILEYIKTKTAKVSLNIVYYSKQRGNFEKKQVVYAFIDLPLINIIKSQGACGDYAFKNKLGMFVCLAKCEIKYEKEAKNYVQQNRNLAQKNKQSYWILLNFLELINFERSAENINWVKFEFVLKGKKYSTEKAHIQHDAINPLRNSYTLLHFSEQDFYDVKIIPITIYTNLTEKYAIDINLKAVAKQLTHQKYYVNNQYFVVVNQSSEAIKMRVGLKIYSIRGSSILSSFFDTLSHNLDTEIFNELSLPQQIGQYQRMLNIFKKQLKLTNRALDEFLNEILINKQRDRLSLDFFTNRTYYKLDFTPIVVDIDSQFEFILEYLPGDVRSEEIGEYIKENNISLMNFRQQFLHRFTFRELNRNKIDKNVDFLGIHDKVDLMSLIRKIKIHDPNDNTSFQQQINNLTNNESNITTQYRELIVTVLEGNNFHQLYNGIKPNAMVRIPDLGIETQIITRNSNPYFNETFKELLESQMFTNYKRLSVQVYHCSTEDQNENILIGEGLINIPYTQLQHVLPRGNKIMKVTLNSLMSNKMKASINIKVGLGETNKIHPDQSSHNYYRESLLQENSKIESKDASRLGQIMQQIKAQMSYKKNLFESSDDQY